MEENDIEIMWIELCWIWYLLIWRLPLAWPSLSVLSTLSPFFHPLTLMGSHSRFDFFNFALIILNEWGWGSGDRISGGRNRRLKVFLIRRSNYFASFQEIEILSVAKLQNWSGDRKGTRGPRRLGWARLEVKLG